VIDRIQELEDKLSHSKSELTEAKRQVSQAEEAGRMESSEIYAIQALARDPENLEVRYRLREELRRKIRRIDLFPNGFWNEGRPGLGSEIRIKLGRGAEWESLEVPAAKRAIKVCFSNGAFRWITQGPRGMITICQTADRRVEWGTPTGAA
jgi:hypothetical protein